MFNFKKYILLCRKKVDKKRKLDNMFILFDFNDFLLNYKFLMIN